MGLLTIAEPEPKIAEGSDENKCVIECETGKVSDGYHTFDELYEHRCVLFLCLMDSHRSQSWKSRKHDDGSAFDGWFIAGMTIGKKAITYHLPEKYWEKAEVAELEKAPKWDGHTSKDVIDRLLSVGWSYR